MSKSRAVALASSGWFVFPAEPDAKKSYLSAEFSGGAKWGMSNDPATVAANFESRPDARVGLPTGAVNRIVVIDLDTKDGKDGKAALTELEKQHGALPETLTAKTPSGGLHLIFAHPGSHVPNSVCKLGDGVDVRGDGGMIIAYETDRTAIAPLPTAWVDLLTPDAAPERTAPSAPKGQASLADARKAFDFLATLEPPLNDDESRIAITAAVDEFGTIEAYSLAARLYGGINAAGLSRINSFEPKPGGVGIGSLRKLLQDRGGPTITTDVAGKFDAAIAAMGAATAAPGQDKSQRKLIQCSADFSRGFVPPSWLVKGILQRRYCYALTAATGTGKTAIALRATADVALGRSFGGHATKAGRVLYIAAENFVDVQGRWIGMAEFCGFDPDTIPVHFIAGEIKISERWESIVQEVQTLGELALVVVDTSAATFEGEDENSNAQAREHAARMRALTTLPGGPTVLVLCHPTKQAKEGEALLPRGGGAFLAEIDGNLIAARKDGSVEVHTAGKFRGPDFAPILFRLETFYPGRLRDEDGQPMPTVVARPLDAAAAEALSTASQDDERQLLDAIHQGAGTLSLAELAKGLGWLNGDGTPAKKKAERIGAALVRRGLAEKTIGGKLKCKSAGEKALNALDAAAQKSGQATVPTPSENRAFVPTKT